MIPEELLRHVWEVTKPGKREADNAYLVLLRKVLNQNRLAVYRWSFGVEKDSGGERTIIPAHPDLAYVQYILARWLIKINPDCVDYCYTGKGVLPAVKVLQKASWVATFDLKSAFDYVKRDLLFFKIKIAAPKLDNDVIEKICDLLTYPINVMNPKQDFTPQGCCSTPYAFNLVVAGIDKQIEVLKKQHPDFSIVRYADNLAIFSSRPETIIELNQLKKNVRAIVEANGFKLNEEKTEVFLTIPFKFLGTVIYPDHLELDPKKYEEYLDILEEAISSQFPNVYRHQITGILNWMKYISGSGIPKDLLAKFTHYFGIVKHQPKSLAWVLLNKQNPRLFD